MISHALSPSAKPPRTCVRSCPVLAPIVVSKTVGKPIILGGVGPVLFRYREICMFMSGSSAFMRNRGGCHAPRVPRDGIGRVLDCSFIAPEHTSRTTEYG